MPPPLKSSPGCPVSWDTKIPLSIGGAMSVESRSLEDMGRGSRERPGCSAVTPKRGAASGSSGVLLEFRAAECCLFPLPIPTSSCRLPWKAFVQNLWPSAPRFCQMLRGE